MDAPRSIRHLRCGGEEGPAALGIKQGVRRQRHEPEGARAGAAAGASKPGRRLAGGSRSRLLGGADRRGRARGVEKVLAVAALGRPRRAGP